MPPRLSIIDIKNQKNQKQLVCLTCYNAEFASIFDDYTDILLVGDSLAMVVYGMKNTLNLSVNTIINHAKAVVDYSKKSCIIVDMPFASYQESVEKAFRNAAKILAKTGACGVKLEGGVEMCSTVEFLTLRGIPVMGHVGLRPQNINNYGNYKMRGIDKKEATQILKDAVALENAGAFALVAENIPDNLAAKITAKLSIPVIGIGAGKNCDGQISVAEDILGLSRNAPKFVKKYANLREDIAKYIACYKDEVIKQ